MLLVEMYERLYVALGTKPVAGREELLAQLAKVIDLSVADRPYCLVFVPYRLPASSWIDHGETTHSELDAIPSVAAGAVRPSVYQ
jgi:hypothetical protein